MIRLITVANNLQLIPATKILAFGKIKSKAILKYIGGNNFIDIVPGTLVISDSPENNIYIKKHTFKAANVNPVTAELLRILSKERLVAIYRDESGNQKVSGSPDYPLELDYKSAGGIYECNLIGKSSHPDLFE